MTDRPTGTPPGIAVGTRVRHKVVPTCLGIVTDGELAAEGCRWAWVRWDGETGPDMVQVRNLEVVAPPVPVSTAPADLRDGPLTISTEYVYAPERALAPGIVSSADTCGGKPRLAGTRMPTDTARRWPDYAAYHAAYPHIREDQYERAACFEAGVRWAKERRKAKKAKGGKVGI